MPILQHLKIRSTEDFWLPQIPLHWDCIKIKFLFFERIEKGYPKEVLLVASQKKGVIPQHVYDQRTVVAQINLHLLKLVKVGDFVISLRSFQGGIEYAYYQGIISPAYTILTLQQALLKTYYKYLFKSCDFIELLKLCVTGVREGQNIDYQKLKNHYIPVPPFAEQEQIVRYLDWKTALINRLVIMLRKEIKEIETLKKAVISKAVTQGINPSVKMKDSGVPWLGMIPEHWDLIKFKRILFSISEKNNPNLPLLSVLREKGVIKRDIEDKKSNHNVIPEDLSKYKVVMKNQFVINKMKAWQGSYGISNYDGLVSPAYYIFNVNFDNLTYFHYAIRSKVYVNFFAQASEGVRIDQWDLSISKMREIPFITPPYEEQKQIVLYIEENMAKYDNLINEIQKKIRLLEELKTTLISEVVTGKIDVRGVEIPEYEKIEEQSEIVDEEEDEMSEEEDEA